MPKLPWIDFKGTATVSSQQNVKHEPPFILTRQHLKIVGEIWNKNDQKPRTTQSLCCQNENTDRVEFASTMTYATSVLLPSKCDLDLSARKHGLVCKTQPVTIYAKVYL